MTWWVLQNVYTKAYLVLGWCGLTTLDRKRAMAWLSEAEAKSEIDRLEEPDAWIAVEE